MQALSRSLPLIVALIAGLPCGAAAAERRAELVRYGDVQIEVVAEGAGPAVVLLPSLARDSDDYDQVAEGLWLRVSRSCGRSHAVSAAAPAR